MTSSVFLDPKAGLEHILRLPRSKFGELFKGISSTSLNVGLLMASVEYFSYSSCIVILQLSVSRLDGRRITICRGLPCLL